MNPSVLDPNKSGLMKLHFTTKSSAFVKTSTYVHFHKALFQYNSQFNCLYIELAYNSNWRTHVSNIYHSDLHDKIDLIALFLCCQVYEIIADVTKEADCERMVNLTIAQFGQLDVLVSKNTLHTFCVTYP